MYNEDVDRRLKTDLVKVEVPYNFVVDTQRSWLKMSAPVTNQSDVFVSDEGQDLGIIIVKLYIFVMNCCLYIFIVCCVVYFCIYCIVYIYLYLLCCLYIFLMCCVVSYGYLYIFVFIVLFVLFWFSLQIYLGVEEFFMALTM